MNLFQLNPFCIALIAELTKMGETMSTTSQIKPLRFLVVEDDLLTRLGLVNLLKNKGTCFEAASQSEAFLKAKEKNITMAFVDLDLEENLSGLKVVEEFVRRGIYTVVLSGHEGEETIRLAYEKGCKDYLVKPLRAEALNAILSKVSFVQEENLLVDFFSQKYLTQDFETKNRLKILESILISDRPVLIQGETGTGKTLVAQLIHDLRFKSSEPFIAINCAEIPENLLESELFGHEKGAFTGAVGTKKGKLLLANEGTLFLDEIATLPLNLQKKLLKALEEKSFYPVGAEKKVQSNFRLISATCEDLKKLISKEEFREDLYFRIEGFNIELPPLRERKEDVPLLLDYFLKNLNLCGRRVILNADVREALTNYSWPGNIRELQKTVQLLLAHSQGIIALDMLPEKFQLPRLTPSSAAALNLGNEQSTYVLSHGLKAYVEKIEEEVLMSFMKKNGEHVRQTLKDLKISNSSFYRILDRLKEKGLYDGK